VPYKRRKRDSDTEGPLASPKKMRTVSTKSPGVAPITIAKEGMHAQRRGSIIIDLMVAVKKKKNKKRKRRFCKH
jgi:hypothetical protein